MDGIFDGIHNNIIVSLIYAYTQFNTILQVTQCAALYILQIAVHGSILVTKSAMMTTDHLVREIFTIEKEVGKHTTCIRHKETKMWIDDGRHKTWNTE